MNIPSKVLFFLASNYIILLQLSLVPKAEKSAIQTSTSLTATNISHSITSTTSIKETTMSSSKLTTSSLTTPISSSSFITTTENSTQTTTKTDSIPSITITNLHLPECSVSCEQCGQNAKCFVECNNDTKQCIHNKTECKIRCECKEGYLGHECNELRVDALSTTTLISVEEENFHALKNKVWSKIMLNLEKIQPNEPNTLLIDVIVNQLRDLVIELVQSQKLDQWDIQMFTRTLQVLVSQNPTKFFINAEQAESLLNSFDDLLELNHELYAKSERLRSILEEANDSNRTSLTMFDCVEELGKLTIKAFNINGKIFKMILTDALMPAAHDTFPHELIHESDMISLDETILKRKYKNNTIMISFRIYFNKRLNDYSKKEAEIKRDEFYKKLEKPKNFFYDLTRSNEVK